MKQKKILESQAEKDDKRKTNKKKEKRWTFV